MSNEPITEHRFPPPKGVQCPHCFMGRKDDGFASYARNADGSTTVKHRPGSVCPTCRGKGRVHVTYTPVEDQR